MHVSPIKNLNKPLTEPSLGSATVWVFLIYLVALVVAPKAKEAAALVGPVAPILGFWISLRVLLRVGKPPSSVLGSIMFALHLLNLLVGAAGIVFAVIGLCESDWER